jgi:hypothetical protein
VALARLRTGSNQLAMNRLKGRIPRNERYCKYCINRNVHEVEDGYHFVMKCPLYKELQDTYLMDITNNINMYTFIRLLSSTHKLHVTRL